MSKKQNELFILAMRQHGNIHLCGRNKDWSNCFSYFQGEIYFWFNTDDGSTHVVMSPGEESFTSVENNLAAA